MNSKPTVKGRWESAISRLDPATCTDVIRYQDGTFVLRFDVPVDPNHDIIEPNNLDRNERLMASWIEVTIPAGSLERTDTDLNLVPAGYTPEQLETAVEKKLEIVVEDMSSSTSVEEELRLLIRRLLENDPKAVLEYCARATEDEEESDDAEESPK